MEKKKTASDKGFHEEIAKIINETNCGHCDFDEATGDVFSHCNRCCRKIVMLISAIVFAKDFYDHSIERIKREVFIQTGVSVEELESPSRKQHIVRARRIAMKRL